MDTKVLEDIGLTRNQATVYMSLLKLGSATAQQVIKESGLHRSPVYDSLDKLQEQGLVSSVVKDFKQYFQAVSPEKLCAVIDEKKAALIQSLPTLKALEGVKKEEIEGSIYKGKEGLKAIHAEMLKLGKGEEILVLGAKGYIYTELEYFIPHFEKSRIKKGIHWKLLWDDAAAKRRGLERELMEGRVLQKGFASKGVVNIFGSKVATVLWKEKYPSAFVIENKDIADSFRKWFWLLWKTAAP